MYARSVGISVRVLCLRTALSVMLCQGDSKGWCKGVKMSTR